MTTNRAHKRAARAIAAEKNIRYPEAVALADDKAEHGPPALAQELESDDLPKVRIVFARRYADLIDARLDGVRIVDMLATSMASIPGVAAKMVCEALPEVREKLSSGESAGSAWAPYKSLMGVHLYQMIKAMDSVGPSASLLRNAANTMEVELRLGIS